MKHSLPELPYAYDALEPIISKETLHVHHDKHHAAYAKKLGELIAGTDFENMTLEEIIKKSSGPLFNNAGQLWNHNFYFEGLRSPREDNLPSGELLAAIEKRWTSFDNFKKEFSAGAVSVFGSGWMWLIATPDGSLELLGTSNAASPVTTDSKALLTCDTWEHAYYIDVQNLRAKYVESFWKIVNWDVVAKRFAT